MSTQNSVVAVYRSHTEADQALKELQSGGVDMHKLSIVGKGWRMHATVPPRWTRSNNGASGHWRKPTGLIRLSVGGS